jgi:hypothetical protein
MSDLLITVAVWAAVGFGGWLGAKELDRAFRDFAAYQAGPRPYPDQDPAPAGRARPVDA